MSNTGLYRKFIIDEMVGKLARLLRMLGYDALYFRQISDSRLIELALSEKRTIVTRDTALVQRVMVKDYVLIKNDNPLEQLHEFLEQLALKPEAEQFLSRCLECNLRLEDVAREEVREKVWPYTYSIHEHFKICRGCGRIYWEGDHVAAMKRRFHNLGIYGRD